MACAGRSAHVRPHRCLGSRGRRAAFGADGCAGLRVSLLPTNYVASALKPVRVTVIRVKRSARSAELSHEVRRQRRWSLISPCIYRRIPSPAPRAHKRQGYKTCATVKKGHTTTSTRSCTPHTGGGEREYRGARRGQGAQPGAWLWSTAVLRLSALTLPPSSASTPYTTSLAPSKRAKQTSAHPNVGWRRKAWRTNAD